MAGNMNEELQNIGATIQYMQAQQQLLVNQINMISNAIIRMGYMLETVSELENPGIQYVNAGNNVFLPVKIDSEKGIIIELGAGFFANVGKNDAIDYLGRRKQKLEMNMERARAINDNLNERINTLNNRAMEIAGTQQS